MGRIDLISSQRFGNSAASIEWAPAGCSLLAVTENDDSVHLYDVRKLSFSVSGGRPSSATPVHSFSLKPHRVKSCVFSPSGKYLVANTTFSGEGMGELRVWNWQEKETPEQHVVYPAHTGAIYSHVFSPDGKRLVTGGRDAIVGLWDVASMVCTHVITRRTKFIRSVAFSHDSELVASGSEEDGIDLADAANGDFVGKIGRGGADEVAFSPKAPLLAWARGDVMGVPPPVAVARINISRE
jgi:WD40 repeat protein